MKTSETIDAQNLQIRTSNNKDLELSGLRSQVNLTAIESHKSQKSDDEVEVKVAMPSVDEITTDEKSPQKNLLQMQGSINSMTDVFQNENQNTTVDLNQTTDTMNIQSQYNSGFKKKDSKLDFEVIDEKYQTQKPQFTAQQRTQNMVTMIQQQKIDENRLLFMKTNGVQNKQGQCINNSYDPEEYVGPPIQSAIDVFGSFSNIQNFDMFPPTAEEKYQQQLSQMQPTKHNQLIEHLRTNVENNIGNSMYEGEGYSKKHVCAANDFKARNSQTNYNFNCECTVCLNQIKKMKHKEEFDLNTKGIKEQKQFKDFMVREVDDDGLALKTQREWLVEKSKKTGRSMVKRRFHNEQPEWEDINRPTYAYTDMIGPDSPKFDYLKDMKDEKLSFMKKKINYVFMQRSYNWLMIHLLSNSDKIAGCEVNIPEQCIFMDCKPKYYLKNDKDGSIMSFNQTKRLNTEVHAHFMMLGIERKKLYGDDAQPHKTPKGNQSLSNSMTDNQISDIYLGKQNTNTLSYQDSVTLPSQLDLDSPEKRKKVLQNLLGVDPEANHVHNHGKKNKKKNPNQEREIPSHLTKHYYKDQYIIRQFQDEGNKDYMGVKTLLLPEAEFIKRDGRMRGHDEFWNSVSCLMMTPQCKIGLGKAYKFTFTPILLEGERDISDKINMEQPKFKDEYPIIPQKQSYNSKIKNKYQGQISYDFNQFGSDDLYLQTKNPQAYCLKACHKIGFFLQQVHQIEILRMDVEFYQDEMGLVQFYSADDIWIRCSEAKSRLLKNTTISKRDTSENSRYVDPNELMLKAPQSFWDNLHKGASCLGTKQRRQGNVQNYICNELSSLIWQSNKDDIQNKEDVIELLTRVNQNMKNDTEEKFSSRMGQQRQLVDKQQRQTRNKQSTTASPTSQMFNQKSINMKAKLDKRMSNADKSKLTTLTSFGEQHNTSYNSRNQDVSIKNKLMSENQKSNKEIFSTQRPKQRPKGNFFDSRNKLNLNTTMTKIGLLGEVNRREVENAMAQGIGKLAYKTMTRLRDQQSPNSEKTKNMAQKNQNLLQWLRNNKEHKKKKPENFNGSPPYQQTERATCFGAPRANSSNAKQVTLALGQRQTRNMLQASLSQPNHRFINTEYNSAEYKKEPDTAQPNDTYQSSQYNPEPMKFIDDNYSYSLESITYEQPVKKSLLHFIKNPNKHVYRYDPVCHPNQPGMGTKKIPILTYSSNRPLNLQEKIIQKISKNSTKTTLQNYKSVPKMISLPKHTSQFATRKLSLEKDLPSVFGAQKDNNISNMTFGSQMKMNESQRLEQAVSKFQQSKMLNQSKSQEKIRSFSKGNEAYQKRIYTDRMKAEQKFDQNLRTGFLDNDFKNDYFKDLNVHLSNENKIHNQLLPDKHQRETTISFMEAQISSNIINLDSILEPITSRIETSKFQSNVMDKNKKIMAETGKMKAMTDMDKSQSTFYTKEQGDMSQTFFGMDTNRPNPRETIQAFSVEDKRPKGVGNTGRNSDIISLNIKFGRSAQRDRDRPLDKSNSKSLLSNVLNMQP